MKILYVTTISNTLNSFLVPHIDELKKAGHTVDIACKLEQPLSQELINNTREFFELQFNRSLIKNDFVALIQQVRQLVRQEEYDIVHTHTPIASAVVRLACRGLENTKVFYTAHGFHFLKGGPLLNWLLYYPIEKILSRYTDTLITINIEDYTIAQNKFRMKHLQLLPGVGIDLEKFYPASAEEKKIVRQKLGLEQDKRYLICIGELNANKNQQILVNMMESLCRQRNDAILLIVGSGPFESKLKQLVKEKKLGKNILFFGYRKDIPDLLKASDIALSSSKREGLPVNIIESMATGLPIIVTDCRGNRDLVTDGVNGYRILSMNLDTFVNKINYLMNNREEYIKFSKQSRVLSNKYSKDNICKELLKFYVKKNTSKLF
ncbi:glycosyltransferase family 4 protein [Streptococcus suis]|uniref:glycosyltransferase family 4 protein n=1 Tax=Streptococcus suis TaxID=1307 RepID=UPI001553CB79|nr:glycosyltransferase family 4 protein [Streptococcus suis]NQL61371.1 glycosyltransferase family 4 protein [Streptococcus suis]NQO46134.1 glycosyltransferase family 4 protein [Streptococcus suis]UUM58702.1 glycosyltransferase family 4 protein [Streptococcus suis]WNF85121.1 glycosyltransferase family 4 protein [Streptococcus suis]